MIIKINYEWGYAMSKEVVSYMLSGMDNMKSLQVQLILQCAPFLKGIKVSCILNISKENEEELLDNALHCGWTFPSEAALPLPVRQPLFRL